MLAYICGSRPRREIVVGGTMSMPLFTSVPVMPPMPMSAALSAGVVDAVARHRDQISPSLPGVTMRTFVLGRDQATR